jgi:HPt (histidine-containing phosphotransfer) domain-containing protein
MELKELIQEAKKDIEKTMIDSEKYISKKDPYFYAYAYGMLEEKIKSYLEKINRNAEKNNI